MTYKERKKIVIIHKKDRKNIILGVFFSFWLSVTYAIIPFILSFILKIYENNSSTDNIHKSIISMVILVSLIVVFGVLGLIFNYLAKHYTSKYASDKISEIREELFTKIQYLSNAQMSKYSNSSLLSRSTNDIFNFSNYYNYYLINALPSLFRFIIFSIVIFFFNWIVSLVLLAITLCFYIFIYFSTRKSGTFYIDYFKKTDEINKVVQENIKGIKSVKSFNLNKVQTKRFDKINSLITKIGSRAERSTWSIFPVSLTLTSCITIIIVLTFSLISMFGNSGNDISQIVAFANFSYFIIWSIFDFGLIRIFKSRAVTSIDRILEILNIDTNEEARAQQEYKNGDIEFKNVSYKFDINASESVLKNISFKIPQGSSVGIIGSTGSGKTTIAKLLAGILIPLEGQICINGIDIREFENEKFVENVSIAFQDKKLFGGTIESNIKFSNINISLEEIMDIIDVVQLKDFIDDKKEGIEYKINQNASNLSGGQQQRLSIARAIAKKSDIIIFDDTTSALDNITERKIFDKIYSRLSKSTKVIISQKVSSIETLDKIIVLDKGMIAGVGKHNDLLSSCLQYKEFYDHQTKQVDND